MTDLSLPLTPERLALIAEIRRACGAQPDKGPTDEEISNALNGFADQIDFWFERVIANAVPKYRNVIIKRINPFVRGIEYQGFSATRMAKELVRDYTNRNFVTSGGWAIEKMAIALGSKNAKAAALGIDLHKVDASTGDQSLYVIKSGMVTRNSDILSALKRHARAAEKLLMQGGAKVRVWANYAVAAGATSTTFHDGIRRPSSAMFWSEVTGLSEDQAIMLAYGISKAAANLMRRETQPHIDALEALVRAYILKPETDEIDWDFIFDRTMKERRVWLAEDKKRHEEGWAALLADGYQPATATATDTDIEDS